MKINSNTAYKLTNVALVVMCCVICIFIFLSNYLLFDKIVLSLYRNIAIIYKF